MLLLGCARTPSGSCCDETETGSTSAEATSSSTQVPAEDEGTTADSGQDGTTESENGPIWRVPQLQPCDPNATAPAEVTLVSWNVMAGRQGPIDQIADELVAMQADIIVVQELDINNVRSDRVDQPHLLHERLGMPYVFATSVWNEKGQFGMGIYSTLPFSEVDVLRLDSEGAYEPRIALSASLCVGPHTVRIVNVHSDFYEEANARNAAETVAWAAEDIGNGVALVGDFNAVLTDPGPQEALQAGLQDVVAQFDDGPTRGNNRIDFVFADQALAKRVTAAEVVQNDTSDHRPLRLTLSY
jgi:endonuclease/exonuclease/phosphatase family metal-dependent hydrolase